MVLLRVKKVRREKQALSIEADCPIYNILAEMSYIFVTETRET